MGGGMGIYVDTTKTLLVVLTMDLVIHLVIRITMITMRMVPVTMTLMALVLPAKENNVQQTYTNMNLGMSSRPTGTGNSFVLRFVTAHTPYRREIVMGNFEVSSGLLWKRLTSLSISFWNGGGSSKLSTVLTKRG